MSASTTARSRARTSTSDKPSVDFNFDTWEQENPGKPFSVVLKGRRYVLTDPTLLDYRDLMEFERVQRGNVDRETVESVFGKILPEGEEEAFFANRLPAGAMMEMLTAYAAHHGLGGPGEAPALSH